MNDISNIFTREERAVFALRKLYYDYGYVRYRMSKFEEYDLYAENKDFLVSKNIITFTDTDGRLLALKPDVTLSIVKSSRPSADSVLRMQYNESVYRVSDGNQGFKELMQVGVECLGAVTDKEIAEVIDLAARSLDTINESNLLELSDLDIINGVISASGLKGESARQMLLLLERKDLGGAEALCRESALNTDIAALLCGLISIYGKPSEVIPKLGAFRINAALTEAVDRFCHILGILDSEGKGDKICIDFSLVGNLKYYNGIAMRGFINGIPKSILSGGQYDKLMKKMERGGGAIGFAVYLDELEKNYGI